MSERCEIATDPSTGRPILVAPERRGRPIHTVAGKDGADVCPFCPGAEASTPPERDAIRAPGTAPDQPGWTARAFPNLFPACAWHEVIAEGAAHRPQPGDLEPEVWADALRLWRRRIAFLEAQPGVRCAFLFKNVGREAGASIAHAHSQVLGLPMLPPRLEQELARCRNEGPIVLPELETAEREGRVVVAGRRHLAFCPRSPKLPFETWLAPRDPADRFDEAGDDEDLVAVLGGLFRAIDRAFGGPAFNLWLHRVPGVDFHWHFEAQPRTGYLAGLELGGDMYINSISGTEAARRLRDARTG
jgi:UDPglucose--hexose-1-phosphate uridylyltransferase